jgi:Ca-activated chloride channel family protein
MMVGSHNRRAGKSLFTFFSGQTAVSLFFLGMGLLVSYDTSGQSSHGILRKGDKKYDKGLYAEAETEYRKAGEDGADASYNLGNALMQQQRSEEAVVQYEKAAASKATNEMGKADAYHNLGNAHYQLKQYDKSIEAYKKALKADPGAADTRHNLALAQYQLKKTQQQQKQKQQNAAKPQNQEDKNQKKPSPGQDSQEKSDQSNENAAPESSEKTSPSGQLKNDEVEKMLQIMDQEEKRVQKKMHKGRGQKVPSEKDW